MFENFFKNKFIPPIWKLGHVKPIFKSGDPSVTNNYRPISLTCILSKTMESIVKDQMSDYLLRRGLISRHQHGFICGKSTCTQLLESIQDWSLSLRCGNSVDVVYIDFSRAFDSIVHSKLLAKLTSYGIGYELHAWIAEFLAGRQQRVFVNSYFSKFVPVISGVPQGSVLGPLLFLIFINDIFDNLPQPVTAKLFADDVKLYSSVSANIDSSHLITALKSLENWADIWQVKINELKSSVMHIGKGIFYEVFKFQAVLYPLIDLPRTWGS